MTKLTSILIASTLLFGISTVSVVATHAQSTSLDKPPLQTSQNLHQGMRRGSDGLSIRKAIDNKDYTAFKNALNSINNEKIAELKTAIQSEDQFNMLADAYAAKKANDNEKFDSIIKQLGLPTIAEKEAKQAKNKANRDAVETAMKNADYEAWKNAIVQSPRGSEILTKITNENEFKTMLDHSKNRIENRKEKHGGMMQNNGMMPN